MTDGIHLYKQRKYKKALDYFLTLNVDSDESPHVSYYLGLCYTHLRKYDKALLYFEQVIRASANFLQVYQSRMVMGYIYAITDRYELAEFELTRLLESGYESAKVYSALAYAMYYQSNIAGSIANLEKAVKIDPHNANALNSLGFILAENNIRLNLALEYCTRAVKRYPENPAYLDSLALVYARMGKKKDAKKLYKAAIQLSHNNPEILEHYRNFLRSTGMKR